MYYSWPEYRQTDLVLLWLTHDFSLYLQQLLVQQLNMGAQVTTLYLCVMASIAAASLCHGTNSYSISCVMEGVGEEELAVSWSVNASLFDLFLGK